MNAPSVLELHRFVALVARMLANGGGRSGHDSRESIKARAQELLRRIDGQYTLPSEERDR